MQRILIVEDQPAVATALRVLFQIHGIASVTESEPDLALERLRREPIAVMIQDMNFSPGATSGEEGMALFQSARRLDPSLPILVLTAWTSLERAVEMVKAGASDYLAKPWDDVKLVAAVRHMLATRTRAEPAPADGVGPSLVARAPGPEATPSPAPDLGGLVVASEAMRRVAALALQVAGADVPVLITGPNGVGKEMVAELIHAHSARRKGPLVKVNAGALPDSLLESELFGAEAGAYTGLTRRRTGRFEAADHGTLFLDEIGNMSEAGQMKLLRVLQSGEFELLGSSQTRRVDVRILAATNVDLPSLIASGRFREDLFFRLNVIEIQLPPLRERPDDILTLAEHFLKEQPPPKTGDSWRLSPHASATFLEHSWPGNVRELVNRIKRATLVAQGSTLEPHDFDLPARTESSRPAAPAEPGLDLERAELERSLREADGKVTVAAERLGVSRQALYRRMERLGIVLERRPKL